MIFIDDMKNLTKTEILELYAKLGNQPLSFGCLPADYGVCTKQQAKSCQKKEETMRYGDYESVNINVPSEFNKDHTAQNYLINRLRDAKYMKLLSENLEKKFGLRESYFKTARELVQAIKDGKFEYVYESDELESENYGDRLRPANDILYGVTFRDPAVKKDRVGYGAVLKQIEEDAKKVEDTIMVLSAEEGLKALQEFEAKDYTA